jgi:hypothetical protein
MNPFFSSSESETFAMEAFCIRSAIRPSPASSQTCSQMAVKSLARAKTNMKRKRKKVTM